MEKYTHKFAVKIRWVWGLEEVKRFPSVDERYDFLKRNEEAIDSANSFIQSNKKCNLKFSSDFGVKLGSESEEDWDMHL